MNRHFDALSLFLALLAGWIIYVLVDYMTAFWLSGKTYDTGTFLLLDALPRILICVVLSTTIFHVVRRNSAAFTVVALTIFLCLYEIWMRETVLLGSLQTMLDYMIVYSTYLAIVFGMVVGSLLGLAIIRRRAKPDQGAT